MPGTYCVVQRISRFGNRFSHKNAGKNLDDNEEMTIFGITIEQFICCKLFIVRKSLSRPEKGLQKRVNLMQQKTNSDLSRHYLPRQLRHLILQEYLSGVKTARQLSEEHGIPMSTIHKMGQRWKAKNSCSFVSTPNPYPIMSRVTSEEASELLSENKALRRRLEEALLRLEGYEIMGDILQEEYGIDLLKKSAAGQSSVSKKDTQQ